MTNTANKKYVLIFYTFNVTFSDGITRKMVTFGKIVASFLSLMTHPVLMLCSSSEMLGCISPAHVGASYSTVTACLP